MQVHHQAVKFSSHWITSSKKRNKKKNIRNGCCAWVPTHATTVAVLRLAINNILVYVVDSSFLDAWWWDCDSSWFPCSASSSHLTVLVSPWSPLTSQCLLHSRIIPFLRTQSIGRADYKVSSKWKDASTFWKNNERSNRGFTRHQDWLIR